ncbi:MAG: aldehyde dehydrogenase family protein [Pigmentiphaga sp.]|uniref:aldehyde dehydrogenase family protein n=1 Tax=Pigmentiphaga sp. TaxID=1977564 RepID=UPI0029AB9FCB|nr:aldehyde dehydrogenase family protein [Pigmentiphaga sp.]MDX3906703.1 aldehyde dehydrogenase family protein [Pigmentiphaga sp.]
MDSPALRVTSPYDGSPVGEIPYTSPAEIRLALDEADALFRNRPRWLPADDRVAILRAAAAFMLERRDSLIETAIREGGKPYRDSAVEVDRAIDGMRNCAELIRSEGGHVVPMGTTAASRGRIAFTQREPIGPVLALSAFNHPVNLIVHQIGPAIAAGCPVLVKPARDTPLSCLNVVRALRDAGLPEAWCRMLVPASHDDIDMLIRDGRIRFLSFIGSAEVGWNLRARLAPGMRCALEHGGIAPVLVDRGADLDQAAAAVAKGGFYHAGQVCVSVQQVFVHREVADGFLERLAVMTSGLKTGDPLERDTDVGPLIKTSEADRVEAWIAEARDQGATVLAGATRLSPSLIAPTILRDAPGHAQVSSKEIFGPVVSVQVYDDLDDACRRANVGGYAFQAGVFTNSIDIATRAYAGLNASAVMINDHSAFRVDWMPFAGLNQSGLGVGGIPHTYREMTIEKMMVLRG